MQNLLYNTISIQAKILQFFLRISIRQLLIKLNFKEFKSGLTTKLDKLIPIKPSVQRELLVLNGHRIWKISSKDSKIDKIVFYIHGGGFIVDAARFFSNILSNWFCKNGFTVFYPQYPLLPKNDIKSIYEDVFLSYKEVLKIVKSAKSISIAGDSAGGALAFGCVQRIIKANLRIPDKLIAISAVADLDLELESTKKASQKDSMFAFETLKSFTNLISADYGIYDAEVNPIYGDFSNFPPTMIVSSTDEALYAAAIRYAKKLQEADVKVINSAWKGMPHDFPLHGFLPEAKKCRSEILSFIDS
jgi:acetyl esterase/lipase